MTIEELEAKLETVSRERDVATDSALMFERDWKDACRERDEALAEAKELREVLTLAGERLKACSYGLTEFAYQEMASVLFDLPCNTEEPTNG